MPPVEALSSGRDGAARQAIVRRARHFELRH
jgi:hypothetical protein